MCHDDDHLLNRVLQHRGRFLHLWCGLLLLLLHNRSGLRLRVLLHHLRRVSLGPPGRRCATGSSPVLLVSRDSVAQRGVPLPPYPVLPVPVIDVAWG